jgi:hypothetical protein
VALLAVFVEYERCGRPDGVKAMKAGRIFLDVDCNGSEILIDKG